MRHCAWVLLALLCACSAPEKRAAAPAPAPAGATITQFYANLNPVPKGETALLCYGVADATTVWLEPPRKELSAALTRCVEIAPEHDTTYKLTAVGADGKPVTRELTVNSGAAHVKIVNLNISALEVKPGELISVCYTVEHARSVEISPIGYRGGSAPKGCATDQPYQSKTYVVRAIGAAGDKDEERVTIKIK